MEVDLLHPRRKWVVWLWWDGVDQAVLYYWYCLWTSGGISWEQDGGVFLPLPFWHSFRFIEMHTSGSSCHTPAADVIE